ncbi:GGDEF domain-containing protein [Butyrivibrio sp. MC2021]|uniref:GGDEF domain-containing protein n=1 Tax=Butyrivibrio sp. MC2021 TaxID=1408306 RepID=UPI0009DF0550|nr:GGDEF domain-containing protein [Butyrivibrio sp. MC2021]
MSNSDEKMLDRAKANLDKEVGDYLSWKQYLWVAATLGVTHCFLEVFYLWLGCTPMIIINIASILSYVVSIAYILKGNTTITIYIMEQEVFLHVILATIFLGIDCGYHLWLFGIFASVFLPFFLPGVERKPRAQIGLFAVLVIIAFEVLVFLGNHHMLPTTYELKGDMAEFIYHVNSFLTFASIMAYTSFYNYSMFLKAKELQWAADHDFLTGLFNRQKSQEILSQEIESDTEDKKLSIAILDIDFFKQVNDSYGHAAGDAVLRGLAEIFRSYKNKGIICGRWGGEEFILISSQHSYEDFVNVLEDIRRETENITFTSRKNHMNVTVSMGAVAYEKGISAEKLVHRADDRLYEAKESGRNKVVAG